MPQCTICGLQHTGNSESCPTNAGQVLEDVTKPAESEDPLEGRTLDDKYRLDERLDGGGMGTVYRATHLLIDRPVAIKVLNPRFADDKVAQERFRREARAAGRVRHINAVSVTDFGRTSDGLLYVVMELLEGRSLQEVLAREGPLDTARAVALMLQISAAVASAHEEGVIHRDLKPGNIFVVQRAHAPTMIKVLDFGIAEMAGAPGINIAQESHTVFTAGTPRYMSPEQFNSGELTPASDVYSLGILLYEMLTGTTPFSGATPASLAARHSDESPRSPRDFNSTIPEELEVVVFHALEKDAAMRPQDAGSFRKELYETAQHLGLEHAEGFGDVTIDSLRSAGTESPSGRLVVDIGRLRENRSARSRPGGTDISTTSKG